MYTGLHCDIGSVFMAMKMLRARVRTVVKALDQTTGQLSEEADRTAASVQTTSNGVNQQQSETEQVATAVNEMSATIQEVATNAANAAEAANEANQSAKEGALTSTEAIGIIDSLASEVENTAAVVEQLNKHSDNIGSVLDVIKGIAEQTNLLALNAAIEAARAGEQGRGFAVVADEVRTLASRTQQSTEEIQEMIEQLQSGTHNAVEAMGKARDRATEGVEQVEAAAEALAVIAGSIATINDMNTHIAAAAEQQSAVTEEINRNVNNINGISQQTADSFLQTASASENLAQLARRLDMMVEQLDCAVS
jgi:methyl-accepting chemotaxis protein